MKTLFSAVTGVAAIVGIVYSAVVFITDRIATKDFHHTEMLGIESSLKSIETATTVSRLVNALNARCELIQKDASTDLVDTVILKLSGAYFRLEQREFPTGDCQNGKRTR